MKINLTFSLAFTLMLLGNQMLFAQQRRAGGFVTIDKVNSPGVGGVAITIKGSSKATVSDNDGKYRIIIRKEQTPQLKIVWLFSPNHARLRQWLVILKKQIIGIWKLSIPEKNLSISLPLVSQLLN